MSDLNLKDLQLIEAIAESGSLTGATHRLHVTQSAISQRLSNLQARLNITLVERRDGVMQLTPAGDRVLAAARLVDAELRSTLRDINSLALQNDQQFRVATQCYTCYRWLPYVIRAMRNTYPMLHVDVVPEATDAAYAAIEKNLIDVAVVSYPDPESELAEVELFNDELFAIMHESHPLARKPYLAAEDFAGQALVLYTSKRHAIVEEILRPAGVSDYSVVEVRITEAIIELARAGRGMAIIAGWALDDMPNTDDLVAVRITRYGFVRTWSAVYSDSVDAGHRDEFIRNVQQAGATINTRKWRSKLQRRAA